MDGCGVHQVAKLLQTRRLVLVCFWHIASFRSDAEFGRFRRQGGDGRTCRRLKPVANDRERPCGLCAACRVLPPARLHLTIVLAAAPTRIASLEFQLGWKKDPKPPSPQ